jgi:hypothetical protein
MSRTEGLSTESFIKRASSTRMTGMRISIMEILLLMMLLLCQQNCRLHLGPYWGPSASEGPQKHDLTMFSKRNM